MTGAEHFAHAEELLDWASDQDGVTTADAEREQYLLQKAQAHATLALAAVTAESIALAHGQDINGYGR